MKLRQVKQIVQKNGYYFGLLRETYGQFSVGSSLAYKSFIINGGIIANNT
jgi:hypothetical protein